jgi:lysophospholipase L1-like esterase
MADEYVLSLSASEIDERLDKAGSAVLFIEQELTEEQKLQIRTNIGAGSIEDAQPTFVNNISECVDINKSYVLPDGYIYKYMQALPKITYETHIGKQWHANGYLTELDWVTTKNTNIIPVTEGDQFNYTGNGQWSISVFWLKSNTISYENIVATETYGETGSPQTVTVTVPAEAKYVMFASWESTEIGVTLDVIPLTVSTEYAWHNTGLTYGTSAYDKRISDIEEEIIILKDNSSADVLKGKKIVYDGDSIAESRLAVAYNGGGYAKIIADMTGGTYVNQAVGGGYLHSTTEEDKHSVVDNLDNLPKDGDLYCFEGGINDYWTNTTLGVYDLEDYTGEVDKTTVCGALETIFRYAINNFVGKPICFVIVHKIGDTSYTKNAEGKTFKDYRDSMVAICEKYSIPYYDAFSESGLNGWNSIQSNQYLTANASGTADGTHPNEEGYKRYYVPQLVTLFKKIISIN